MDISLTLKYSKILTDQTSSSLVHMTPTTPSTPVLLTNKVAITRQETHDIVRDLFSALSFEKSLSSSQKRGMWQKLMSLDYSVCRVTSKQHLHP